ncbi:hypothetical protein EIP91_005814 [Steccherinum ochraceum]|uniref:DUF6534 domain-containing protein n=1 Tax=Steccherinum ochraceum TaxID=92696 RepID=A0A4R0RF28_9APHY|nr:hypothetical protein EIP91_005814 [Steccherinum ochraceum]
MAPLKVPVGPTINFALLLGPMLIGEFMNWGLFGVLSVQLYIYYLAFPDDPIHAKGLVALIYTLEIAHLVLTTHDGFDKFAAKWGDILHVDSVETLWISVPILTGLSKIPSFVSKLFYSWRIHTLGKNIWITAAVVLTALAQFGLSIWDGLETLAAKHIEIVTQTKTFKASIWGLSAAALCDIMITMSMSYYLWKAKKSSSVRKTSARLNRLIRYTVESGFLTAAFAATIIILFATSTHTELYTLFLVMMPKLYSNSLLALFNSRIEIANGRIADSENVVFMSDIDTPSRSSPSTGPNGSSRGIKIHIAKARHAHNDSMDGKRGTEKVRLQLLSEVSVSKRSTPHTWQVPDLSTQLDSVIDISEHAVHRNQRT